MVGGEGERMTLLRESSGAYGIFRCCGLGRREGNFLQVPRGRRRASSAWVQVGLLTLASRATCGERMRE